MGLKIMDGDEAFYFLHEEGHLRGAVLTHVDNFNLASDDDFIKKFLHQVERELTVSKVKRQVLLHWSESCSCWRQNRIMDG